VAVKDRFKLKPKQSDYLRIHRRTSTTNCLLFNILCASFNRKVLRWSEFIIFFLFGQYPKSSFLIASRAGMRHNRSIAKEKQVETGLPARQTGN
jgi:hypothetical protein